MHTLCGWCSTNEVVQFFVYCGTFVLSVGLLFFNAGSFFSQAMSLSTPCEEFLFFFLLFRRIKFETTSHGARVGIRKVFRVSVCAGVCWCLGVFFCSYSLAVHRVNHARHNAIHIGHRMP